MKLVLGAEHDEALRARLLDVVHSLGATAIGPAKRAMAGSQELLELDVSIDGQSLRIAAETYMGLSICGPDHLVRRVRDLVLGPSPSGAASR
jgi:hypothetical protein